MTNAAEFYRDQADTVRRSLPNFINELQAASKARQRAARAAFDAVPNGRKAVEKAEKKAAQETLVLELAAIENWYEAEFSAWEATR